MFMQNLRPQALCFLLASITLDAPSIPSAFFLLKLDENPADAFLFSVTCGDGKGWIGSFFPAIGSLVPRG